MGDRNRPSGFAFFRFGLADLVFLFFALTLLQRAGHGMLDDPGLGWQLRIPDAMVDQGGFLYTDPFCGPTLGKPWPTFGFIGSSLMRLAELWGDLRGLAMLTVLTLAFLLRCLYQMMIHDGVPWPQALFWSYLAALGTSSGWVARPNLFTIFFFLFVVRACVLLHQERLSHRCSLWLLPLFAVWANTHGGFAAGLATIGVAGLIEAGMALTQETEQAAAWGRFRWFTVLGFACLAATLVNPYGWGLHRHIAGMLGDTYIMNLNADWLSPDFHLAGAFRFELLILLLPLLLAVSPRRPDAVSLGLTLLWLHLALQGRRYIPLWVLTVVPILAVLAAETVALRRLSAWLDDRMRDGKPAPEPAPEPAPAAPAPWFWTAVFALALFASARYVGDYGGHDPEHMPAQALDRLLEVHRDNEKVFHSPDWGGYLTWHGWPRFRTWIDDRNELHRQERIQEWLDIMQTKPGWRKKFDDYGFQLVCIEAGSSLDQRLAEDGHWKVLYRDNYAVIYRKEPAAGGRDG